MDASVQLSSRSFASTTYPTITPSTSISNIHPHSTTHTTISKSTHWSNSTPYSAEAPHVQTTPLELQDIHHSSGRVLEKRDYIDSTEGSHPAKEDSREEIKEPWATLDEEKRSESEIKKVPSWLPSNPPCG